MFFAIHHARSPVPLRAIFSSDGVLFFKATDVAGLLKYKNKIQFAAKNARLKVKDIMYKRIRLPPSVLKSWVFSVEEAVDLLKNSQRSDCGFLADRLADPENTRILRTLDSGSDLMMADHGRETLANFLEEARTKHLETYDELTESYKEMHVYRSRADWIPEKIKVFCGDKVYTYKLI